MCSVLPPLISPPQRPPDPGHSAFFEGWSGQLLHYRRWPACVQARAIVVIVHGIGGHSGQFGHLVEGLTRAGFIVCALDLPGHGLSPGQRGWIPRWEVLRSSLGRLLSHLGDDHPQLPRFLIGHSLGGTVVLDLILDHPIAAVGVILSNPALDAGGVSPWRLRVARGLSRLWPRFSLATGIPLETACRDPEEVASLARDPLRHDQCTARLGMEFLDTTSTLWKNVRRFKLPLLMLQSGADSVTRAEVARQFFESLTMPDRTWRLYPESFHEIFTDLDRDRVIEALINWLQHHVD